MRLGITTDGRALAYDAALYEFSLGREVVRLQDVVALETHGYIKWRAPELHDWFKRLDPESVAKANAAALRKKNDKAYAGMTPEERVLADAARDDSIIAGKLVEADPALVQAVAYELEQQGLIGGLSQADENLLSKMDLPAGMEPLSQMLRSQGRDRKMTATEKRLMQKILKADDKAKEKREKLQEATGNSEPAPPNPDERRQPKPKPKTPAANTDNPKANQAKLNKNAVRSLLAHAKIHKRQNRDALEVPSASVPGMKEAEKRHG